MFRSYDCIKIYNIFDWSPEAYDAALQTAGQYHLPAVGHLPRNLPVETTIRRGRQTIEHAEELLYPYFFKHNPRLDEARIPYLVKLVKDSGAAVTPTIFVYHAIALIADDATFQELTRKPELKYLSGSLREQWATNEKNRYRKNFKPADAPSLNQTTAFLGKVTRSLQQAGVTILLGADSSPDQPFIPRGSDREPLTGHCSTSDRIRF